MRVHPRFGDNALGVTALFLASGTLLCCALPLLLVALGLGSVVAATTSAAPWLVALSRYKTWMFAVSGLALGLAAWALFRPGRACPTDPELARWCAMADRWNRRVYWAALAIWAGGAFIAYLGRPILEWLEV